MVNCTLNPDKEESLWLCPHCGTRMQKVTDSANPYRVCTQCGCVIEGEEQEYNPGIVCPNCNQEIDVIGECPHCGYDLGSDFD